MITEDIEIVKKIFSLLDEGIVNEYDSFVFNVDFFDVFQESELLVTSQGIETDNAETTFNRAVLYSLIDDLNKNFELRGKAWRSFSLSYTYGGEVKTNFTY